jgi:YD repeat-containing protein
MIAHRRRLHQGAALFRLRPLLYALVARTREQRSRVRGDMDMELARLTRCLLFVGIGLLAVSARPAAAQEHPSRSPDVIRADLRSITVQHLAPRPAGGWAERASERLVYDDRGRLIEHSHDEPGTRVRVRLIFVWDESGRLIERRYSDHKGRLEVRRMTYKLDAQGRISESDQRDPRSPPGEFHRDVYTWEPDGRRTVRTYRHYAKEGPYPDGSSVYDAQGRPERHCSASGGCSLYEYDERGEISRIRQQNRDGHHYLHHENRYDDAGRLEREIIGGTEHSYRRNQRGDIVETITRMGGRIESRKLYAYEYRSAR